ncbi:MAG TPA: ABC transporter ATP-binding protein [Candidatus Merdibacter merdavium]|uniref:ABC transporter ATP-binding protein n=1 Tax=Candidatus Merdibacter merdavium TaxID=2838692 RepID=A0A9D2NQU4_9FIRM|nr:ABC transporter ATP-binding protein [Candidatus Merdibacter merdavium]
MRTILEAKDLWKSFGLTKAVQGISLTVYANDFIAVLGKSGSGKTTLFHILDGITKPDRGEVCIAGQNISKMRKRAFVEFRRKNMGYVFQDFKLIPEFSVVDNITFPVDLDKEKIDEFYLNLLLEELDIKKLKDRLVNTLSGGEQQRVAIARALINKQEIVMADEPTGNLDSYNTEKVMHLMVRLQKMFSLTVLIATHDYAVAKSAKRMLYIQDGKILKDAQRYE